jgi:hypothetical protein
LQYPAQLAIFVGLYQYFCCFYNKIFLSLFIVAYVDC